MNLDSLPYHLVFINGVSIETIRKEELIELLEKLKENENKEVKDI